MSVKSLSSSSLTNNVFYRSLLAGSDPFTPFNAADDLLEEITLTSSASSVTFSGLGAYSDYAHLQIRAVARTNRPLDDVESILMNLNGDYGSNYTSHALDGNGSLAGASAALGQTAIFLRLPSNLTTDAFGSFILDVLDFQNASKNTTTRALIGAVNSTYPIIQLGSGLWNSTSAVTSISFACYQGGSVGFTSGSRFSLIGIR